MIPLTRLNRDYLHEKVAKVYAAAQAKRTDKTLLLQNIVDDIKLLEAKASVPNKPIMSMLAYLNGCSVDQACLDYVANNAYEAEVNADHFLSTESVKIDAADTHEAFDQLFTRYSMMLRTFTEEPENEFVVPEVTKEVVVPSVEAPVEIQPIQLQTTYLSGVKYEPRVEYAVTDRMKTYFYETKTPDASPVLVIPNFLSAEEVDFTLKSFSTEFEYAKLTMAPGVHVENKEIRTVETAKCVDFSKVQAKRDAMFDAIKNYWVFDHELAENHNWQGLTYRVGGHYKWHNDNGKVIDGSWDMSYVERSFSLVLFLTDWVHDYATERSFTGGELLFTHLINPIDNSRYCVFPKAGMLIAFQSNPLHMHQVNPVKTGVRVSLVNWIGDPRRKIAK